MRRILRPALFAGSVSTLCVASLPAQSPERNATVVIAVTQEPVSPIPALLGSRTSNRDVSELIFLPLARLGPGAVTIGDKGFVPQLARSWSRRDPLTLVFEMDPRARWHDGAPVTARDAALALNLARDPSVDPSRALLLRRIASATAEDDRHLVVRFTEAYDEQLYDAIFHVSPLPAHLVDTIPKGQLATSAYAAHPVGSGPYKWVRRVPGQQLDLEANDAFFLGKPGPRRVTILPVREMESILNLLSSDVADVTPTLGPLGNIQRMSADKRVTIYPLPSYNVGSVLFNQRDPADLSKPHPILADLEVRRAIVMALDVPAMVRATFGDWATVPYGPVPQMSWIRDPSAKLPPPDPASARALLRSRGWSDSDGDGILDRHGKPLTLGLNYPAPAAPRAPIALLIQEQLRQVGIRIEVNRLEGSVWLERRAQGLFDLDFGGATMDPSPSGMVQSWSCSGRGGSNVAWFCDPKVDSLLEAAQHDRKRARTMYRAAAQAIVDDAAAIFIYSTTDPFTVASRIRGVDVDPTYPYSAIWRWRPGAPR